MTYEQIRYDVDAAIATITLHRPERLNAFTGQMMRELIDAFERADRDDAVRVVIVTGAGRAFCAGADLSAGSGTFDHTHGTEPPSIDAHEVTDKGSLNQGAVLKNRAALVVDLYSPRPSARVISIQKGV